MHVETHTTLNGRDMTRLHTQRHTRLQEIVDCGLKLTPMMKQYFDIKSRYPETLVLFRMGDFYEVFFEDAVETSRLLNIALTHRGKIGDFSIPMAGIPHHASATYIDKLTDFGLKVAICEQVQDPKEAKGIVKRAVTQIVSPSMPFDLDKFEARENHFMISAYPYRGEFYLAGLGFTTGEFIGFILKTPGELIDKIQSLSPKEYLGPLGAWENLPQVEQALNQAGVLKTHLSEEYFEPNHTEIYTEKLIPTFKKDKILSKNKRVLAPVGAIAYYVCSTQDFEQLVHIRPFRILNTTDKMKVSTTTLQGLEILPKSIETYKESLLGYLDNCRTSMGSRNLKKLLQTPLQDPTKLNHRYDFVEALMTDPSKLKSLREDISDVRDLERILAKVSTSKVNSQDLINTKKACEIYFKVIRELPTNHVLPSFKKKEVEVLKKLQKRVEQTLSDEIGARLEKGNLIKVGFSKKRDRLAKLSQGAHDDLDKLQESYRRESGIQKLRVKFNNVAGYFIEVSKSHADKVPKKFRRRQTLVNSERYTTDELDQFEKEIIAAKDKLEKIEREIFKELVSFLSELRNEIHKLAAFFGKLDSFFSFSWVALQDEFQRPQISETKMISLKGAFHPLIRKTLKDHFVCHNLYLDCSTYFGLITGPNMAGKTTVMREVAIIQLLAQVGCLVPASHCQVSLCDFLFSRLGAQDDILKGQSTFMVEMSETAEIVRHATDRSLIILDEVGRGTSTYDGLSIAWALVEYFIDKTKALTLFATHYHELIELIENQKGAKNFTVETQNKGSDVQFLYRLIEKGASQSFGLYVAKLAGLPPEILKRSKKLLQSFEEKKRNTEISGTQLNFFEQVEQIPMVPEYLTNLEGQLEKIDTDKMTPLEAIQQLAKLKTQLDQAKKENLQ